MDPVLNPETICFCELFREDTLLRETVSRQFEVATLKDSSSGVYENVVSQALRKAFQDYYVSAMNKIFKEQSVVMKINQLYITRVDWKAAARELRQDITH